jgi:flavodoxin
MRALVVYESMFGHTEQVARAIAAGVSVHSETDVRAVDYAPEHIGSEFDLIVVGGPTHAFGMTRSSTRADALDRGATHGTQGVGIREWLDRLDAECQGALVATFDTRVQRVRRLPGSAAKAAAKRIRSLGFDAAAQPESFYVLDVDGPLGDGELERAKAWGRTVALSARYRQGVA